MTGNESRCAATTTTGLGACLDVVHHHLGPSGNHVHGFGPYFTDRHHTPCGQAVDLDDDGSEHVRRFVVDNALRWFREFHVDALRLDAVHALTTGERQGYYVDFGEHATLAKVLTSVFLHDGGRASNVVNLATEPRTVPLGAARGGPPAMRAWPDGAARAGPRGRARPWRQAVRRCHAWRAWCRSTTIPLGGMPSAGPLSWSVGAGVDL